MGGPFRQKWYSLHLPVVEPPAAVPFYFDFISPYAYLGWVQVHSLVEPYGRAVTPVPLLFAGLLDAHGNVGPAEIPAKRAYIFKDTLRHALALEIAFRPPPSHPFNPLLALRVASLPLPDGDRRRVIDTLFRATWGGGAGVTDAQEVEKQLNDLGLDGAAMIEAAAAPEIKALVRSNTEAAVARGVFGVPTLLIDGELFWGIDSFAHAKRRLDGEDPLTPSLLSGFGEVPASAVRPRAPSARK
jgi:2-hydroxychromene-2-carboxylate isomerase